MKLLKINKYGFDTVFICLYFVNLALGALFLRSVYPTAYPQYLLFLFLSIIIFFIFIKIDFDVLQIFSKHFYILSIILLIVVLIIGQATRGVIRWIPLGQFSFQPSEIVKPFLLLFLANNLIRENINIKVIIKAVFISVIPLFLIFIQPSLGVSILTAAGMIGIFFASSIDKKKLLLGILLIFAFIPLSTLFLKDYQKQRLISFINPYQDPSGMGYNGIQAMIAVGSGGINGKGFSQGEQTQLMFLPEKNTDFIFAAVSEEFGFIGSMLILILLFSLLFMFIIISQNSINTVSRAYVSAAFLTFFLQIFIHIGMNMGIAPITGIPLPFYSMGGSSLIGYSIMLAIVLRSRKKGFL